jgi:hypothetical protein
MSAALKLRESIRSRSLTALTKSITELANELAYQLKTPYTEIMRLKAREDGDRFTVIFAAKLHLHYTSLEREEEGLVFTIQFGGDTLAESPTPPVHELFYAAAARSLFIHGYGSRWKGKPTVTPKEFAQNLEVKSEMLAEIETEDFFRILEAKL